MACLGRIGAVQVSTLRGGAQGGRARLDPPGKRVWVEHQSDIRPAAPRGSDGPPALQGKATLPTGTVNPEGGMHISGSPRL